MTLRDSGAVYKCTDYYYYYYYLLPKYRDTTDTTNAERARQQGSRALAAALKKGKKYNEIQHELVNKVLIERLKLAREEKATASDGKLFQISVTRSEQKMTT